MTQEAYLYDLSQPHQPFLLTELFLIGADSGCNLKLKGEGVSERHTRIEFKGQFFLIRDLRSETGTFVNGTKISEAYLCEGDEIRIGSTVLQYSHEKRQENASIGLSSKNETWNAQLMSLGHVAKTEFSILLLGPSGTGKEVLAQALHQHSSRSNRVFISVNCSALTETIVESELFGHVKGSFTGAVGDRKGAFETARGGTLFLDEIGDLPLTMQAKLLRALENNEIRPVGSDQNVETDVRIIAATHQNLKEKISEGSFRADLYYRLAVITVQTPALTDRMEDFENLMYGFAKKMKVQFSFNAIEKMKRHTWPGNIRELKNTVARASAFFPRMRIDEGHVEKILDQVSLHATGVPAHQIGELPVIKEIEKQMIIKRLAANQGNQRRTAMDLGIPKSTLHDRIRAYNIDTKQFVPVGTNLSSKV
jgi:DNA-binding NtrC family response regulator